MKDPSFDYKALNDTFIASILVDLELSRKHLDDLENVLTVGEFREILRNDKEYRQVLTQLRCPIAGL